MRLSSGAPVPASLEPAPRLSFEREVGSCLDVAVLLQDSHAFVGWFRAAFGETRTLLVAPISVDCKLWGAFALAWTDEATLEAARSWVRVAAVSFGHVTKPRGPRAPSAEKPLRRGMDVDAFFSHLDGARSCEMKNGGKVGVVTYAIPDSRDSIANRRLASNVLRFALSAARAGDAGTLLGDDVAVVAIPDVDDKGLLRLASRIRSALKGMGPGSPTGGMGLGLLSPVGCTLREEVDAAAQQARSSRVRD
jgi:hypothetical protein